MFISPSFIVFYIVASIKSMLNIYHKWETYVLGVNGPIDSFYRYSDAATAADANNMFRYLAYIAGFTEELPAEQFAVRRVCAT